MTQKPVLRSAMSAKPPVICDTGTGVIKADVCFSFHVRNVKDVLYVSRTRAPCVERPKAGFAGEPEPSQTQCSCVLQEKVLLKLQQKGLWCCPICWAAPCFEPTAESAHARRGQQRLALVAVDLFSCTSLSLPSQFGKLFVFSQYAFRWMISWSVTRPMQPGAFAKKANIPNGRATTKLNVTRQGHCCN